jgi:hypothetical protein
MEPSCLSNESSTGFFRHGVALSSISTICSTLLPYTVKRLSQMNTDRHANRGDRLPDPRQPAPVLLRMKKKPKARQPAMLCNPITANFPFRTYRCLSTIGTSQSSLRCFSKQRSETISTDLPGLSGGAAALAFLLPLPELGDRGISRGPVILRCVDCVAIRPGDGVNSCHQLAIIPRQRGKGITCLALSRSVSRLFLTSWIGSSGLAMCMPEFIMGTLYMP